MGWTEVNTSEDIKFLQKTYGNFEDSVLVNFRYESGNYIDSNQIGYEYNNNNLILLFQRLDGNPFSIEILFEYTKRFNFLAPIATNDTWRSEITYAKIDKNDEFFYWTKWEDFNPYNPEHLKYNDFILIEAKRVKWRVV